MPRAKKTNMINEPFPTRFRELIEESGLSQAQLAKALSTSRQAISSYVMGDSSPDINRLVDIADYFDVTFDYLLGKSDSRHRENLSIADKIGLSDAAISALENQMKFSDEHGGGVYREAINTVLSSEELLGYLISFMSIKENGDGSLITSVKDPKHDIYHLMASPNVYAAALFSRIEVIMNALRVDGAYSGEGTSRAFSAMIDEHMKERKHGEAPTDGEHPQE